MRLASHALFRCKTNVSGLDIVHEIRAGAASDGRVLTFVTPFSRRPGRANLDSEGRDRPASNAHPPTAHADDDARFYDRLPANVSAREG